MQALLGAGRWSLALALPVACQAQTAHSQEEGESGWVPRSMAQSPLPGCWFVHCLSEEA